MGALAQNRVLVLRHLQIGLHIMTVLYGIDGSVIWLLYSPRAQTTSDTSFGPVFVVILVGGGGVWWLVVVVDVF